MMRLDLDDVVDVGQEAGRIVIEPVRQTYDLGDLLKGITAENVHDPIELGSPEGKEV